MADAGRASDVALRGMTVDECFNGLRALSGAFQDATHASTDGAYVMRLALETADRAGTSGSYGWAAIRFALQTAQGSICITDEAALAAAYKGSHHNCMDNLTVQYGNGRYSISNPDSAADYTDKTKWRREAIMIATREDVVLDPIHLPTVKCNRTDRADGSCWSGGPCQ